MNISEACGRNSDAEYVQSLQTSFSSGSEAEYQLLLARDLGYVDPETHQILDEQVCEVKRILAVIMRTIRRRLPIRPRSRSRLPDSDAPPSTPDA